jgi:hypothetical protein
MGTGDREEPRRHGPYRVIEPTGGDGELYGIFLAEAESGIRAGQQVDLTVLRPGAVAESGGPNRLATEIAAVRRVRSPRVVAIVDVDMYAPEPWIATEHVTGPSLERAVSIHRPVPPAALDVLGYGLADALATAHDAGVTHRDVAPGNVYLTAGGPLLSGFLIGGTANASSSYRSLEQASGGHVGPPSDVYSLAVTLAFAATGPGSSPFVVPFPGLVPARLRDLLGRCLLADPAQRPTAREVRDRIGPPGPEAMAAYRQYLAGVQAAIDTPPTPSPWGDPGQPTGYQYPAAQDVPAGPGGASMGPDPWEWYTPQTELPADWRPPAFVVPEVHDVTTVWQPQMASQVADRPVGDRPRFLRGQCPHSVRAGEPFSVLASIVREARTSGTTPLKPFAIGPGGSDILLVLDAPGLVVLGEQRQRVRVRPDQDCEPVMFELRADEPGPVQLEVSAWDKGSYLGRLTIETAVLRDAPDRGQLQREFVGEIDDGVVRGEVSLVVRYDHRNNSYRFEFRDEDNPEEVVRNLAYEPGPRVERLIADLDRIARGRSGYSNHEALDYMREAGAELWQELIPAQLREQFWARQARIRQLTILSAGDKVPWELLYPRDRGHDSGFLVEQFPVTRLVFGRRPARTLHLAPARFVLPGGAPQSAREEVSALSRLLMSRSPKVISELTPLLELIRGGQFGVLHFACHNNFDPAGGSAITLDKRPFEPRHLTTAAIDEALAASAPLVFINACRSAGASPGLHELDGWASKFLQAGAAAFIGSLWAIRDAAAGEFASVLYDHLRYQFPLGRAVMAARAAAALGAGDPTWLAYAVYGDPRASVR